MRISDWSSDVCSSDLEHHAGNARVAGQGGADGHAVAGDQLQHRLRHAGLVQQLHRLETDQGGLLGRLGQHAVAGGKGRGDLARSEEHTSELQSLMRISYAVFCWKKKTLYTLVLISLSDYTTQF